MGNLLIFLSPNSKVNEREGRTGNKDEGKDQEWEKEYFQ